MLLAVKLKLVATASLFQAVKMDRMPFADTRRPGRALASYSSDPMELAEPGVYDTVR